MEIGLLSVYDKSYTDYIPHNVPILGLEHYSSFQAVGKTSEEMDLFRIVVIVGSRLSSIGMIILRPMLLALVTLDAMERTRL